MKNKFIPLEKQSKKMRKAYYAKHRRTWNGVDPMVRVMPNAKAYDRKSSKQKLKNSRSLYDDNDTAVFLCFDFF